MEMNINNSMDTEYIVSPLSNMEKTMDNQWFTEIDEVTGG